MNFILFYYYYFLYSPNFTFFVGGYPALPAPFAEENILSPLNDIGTLVENLQKLKIKIELPYDPVIPLLDIYPKKTKTLIRKDTCTPIFIAALFTIAKIWKQPMCPPADGWIKKIWYIYTMGYYSAIKNEKFPSATTWMDVEGIMLSEISQTEKGNYCVISLICGI